MTDVVPIATPDGDMPGHLWLPEARTGPGIVLLQEIFGISSYIERRAQDLVDLGYVVLAPAIYWRLGVTRVEDGPTAMDEAFALAQRVDWPSAVQDGVRALSALRERPEVSGGVGIVGFCFGGGLGFNVASEEPADVLVSYYGSALRDLLGLRAPSPGTPVVDPARVTAPSLHHFGLADSFIDRPTVEQIRAILLAVGSVTFETYEGADHAFDNDDFRYYDPEASALAWRRTVDYLAGHLPVA